MKFECIQSQMSLKSFPYGVPALLIVITRGLVCWKSAEIRYHFDTQKVQTIRTQCIASLRTTVKQNVSKVLQLQCNFMAVLQPSCFVSTPGSLVFIQRHCQHQQTLRHDRSHQRTQESEREDRPIGFGVSWQRLLLCLKSALLS